jgi:hypothetical protein
MGAASKRYFGSFPAEHPGAYFIAYYLAVVVVSIAAFRLLEEPARKAIRNSARGHARPVTDSS